MSTVVSREIIFGPQLAGLAFTRDDDAVGGGPEFPI